MLVHMDVSLAEFFLPVLNFSTNVLDPVFIFFRQLISLFLVSDHMGRNQKNKLFFVTESVVTPKRISKDRNTAQKGRPDRIWAMFSWMIPPMTRV